jgi:hypothetical protein
MVPKQLSWLKFSLLSQPLQETVKLGYDRFLSRPFQRVIHKLSCHSKLYCDMTPENRNKPFISRQRLGKHIPAATNTQATIE